MFLINLDHYIILFIKYSKQNSCFPSSSFYLMNKRTLTKLLQWIRNVMRTVCVRSASRRGRPREETSTSTDSTQQQPPYRMTVQNVDDPNNNRSFLVLKDPNNNSDQLADSRWLGRGDKPPTEGEKWVPSWADGKASR